MEEDGETGEIDDGDDDVMFSADMLLRRNFTVKTSSDVASCEMLKVSKNDLFRMKIEYREIFSELFTKGVAELEKTIAAKLAVMEVCDELHSKDNSTTFTLNVITNKQLLTLTDEQIYQEMERYKHEAEESLVVCKI